MAPNGAVLEESKELSFTDYAAGNFSSGVAGRLRAKVIGVAVDHNGLSDDLPHTETVCPHGEIRAALKMHQWRKVAGVIWMICFSGVIVAAGFREVCSGTGVSFMNVKGKETCFACLWKSGQFCDYQNTFAFLIKPHFSG